MKLIEQNEHPERPDLKAAAIANWPQLAKLQAWLNGQTWFRFSLNLTRQKAFQRWFRIIVVVAFLTFIGAALYKNWNDLQEYRWQIDLRYLILTVVAFPAAYLPTVWCWHHLMRRTSSFSNARANTHVFCISSLGRYVPGFVWYIAGRAYWYRDYDVPGSHVVISTIWENLVFLTSGFLIYLFLGSQQIIIGGLALILVILLYPRLFNHLLYLANEKLGTKPIGRVGPLDVLALLVALGVAWAMGGILLWWVTNAIHPINASVIPRLIGSWGLAGAVSVIAAILVGGLGIRELTLGALLAQIIPPPVAIVVALVFRLVLTLAEALWALSLGWITGFKKPITQKD